MDGVDRWARGLVAGLVVGSVLVGAGCSGSSTSNDGAGAAAGAATASLATTAVHPLRADLLDIAEVRTFVVLGLDSRQQPVLDPRTVDLAVMRGPCGAMVPTPFAPQDPKSFRVFRSTNTQVVEAIAEPGASAATAFVDQFRADARTQCPAVAEQLADGPLTTVRLGSTLELPVVGDDRVGWSATVTTGDGDVSYRYVMAAAAGPRVTMIVIVSPRPLAVDALLPVLSAATS